MKNTKKQEIHCVAQRVRQLGLLDPGFKMGEEFYPAHLSVALIDAVFTPRSHYENHVLPVIRHYCEHFNIERTRPGPNRELLPPTHKQETLQDLVSHYKTHGKKYMREEIFKARYRSPGTKTFKSDNVYLAAEELLKIGINNLQDASQTQPGEIKKAFCSINGIGPATAHMFLMYCGRDDYVKGDVHVCAFVAEALCVEKVGPREAEQIIIGAAGEIGITPRTLDYAIWKYGSNFSGADS